jgi:hypothetical protein
MTFKLRAKRSLVLVTEVYQAWGSSTSNGPEVRESDAIIGNPE